MHGSTNIKFIIVVLFAYECDLQDHSLGSLFFWDYFACIDDAIVPKNVLISSERIYAVSLGDRMQFYMSVEITCHKVYMFFTRILKVCQYLNMLPQIFTILSAKGEHTAL
jgi:hypothetical protein